VPDLLTHAGIGLLVRAGAPRSPLVWFVVGSTLPDLASRLPGLGMVLASWLLGFGLPVNVLEATGLGHMPLPYLVLCGLIALLLPEDLRWTAWLNLSLGGLLHLALDTAQTHLVGGYRLLYPFSMQRWELGLIETEDSLALLPWLALVVAVVLAGRAWWSRRRVSG
jgi:hypothetical protein